MAFGNINLGNLAAALRITGGDERAADDLLRRQAVQDNDPTLGMRAPAPAAPNAPRAPGVDPMDSMRAPQAATTGRDPLNAMDNMRGPTTGGLPGSMQQNPYGEAPPPAQETGPVEIDPPAPAQRTYGGTRAISANPYADDGADPDTLARARSFIGTQRQQSAPESPTAGIDPDRLARVQQKLSAPSSYDIGPVDPRQTIKQLRGGLVDSGNQRIGIDQDVGASRAQASARRADLVGAETEAQAARNAQYDQRAAASTQRRDGLNEDVGGRVDTIMQLVKNRPTEPNAPMRKAGEALMMIPGLGLIGAPMAGIANKRHRDAVAEWEGQVRAAAFGAKAGQDQINSENNQRESEGTQAQQRAILAKAELANRYEQVAQSADSEEQRFAASLKALDAKDSLSAMLIGQKTAEQKQAAAVRQKKQDASLLSQLARTPEEQRALLAANYGPRGLDMLGKLQKPITGQAEIEGKRSSTDKNYADISKTGADINQSIAQTDLTRANISKTNAETTKLGTEIRGGRKLSEAEAKLQRQAAGVTSDYRSMLNAAQDIKDKKPGSDVPYIGIGPGASKLLGTESAQKMNMAISQLASPLMYDSSGAVIGDDEKQQKYDAWGFTSPDQHIRNQAPARLLAEFEARVGAVDPNMLTSQPDASAAPASGYSRQEAEDELKRRSLNASR